MGGQRGSSRWFEVAPSKAGIISEGRRKCRWRNSGMREKMNGDQRTCPRNCHRIQTKGYVRRIALGNEETYEIGYIFNMDAAADSVEGMGEKKKGDLHGFTNLTLTRKSDGEGAAE